ncbi:hypothetical protein [Nocardioides sp. WS12]|uniref:hypothetical protein n=1 Tax=Nocardioides sp. WS12 TaxID=2486272 RepID=UPI0015FA3842|nr:hypothetical protein [Nocardioides sp. WS12]
MPLIAVKCTQPACLHASTIAEPLVDAYLCGSDAICACHPIPLAQLGVRALPCKGAVA